MISLKALKIVLMIIIHTWKTGFKNFFKAKKSDKLRLKFSVKEFKLVSGQGACKTRCTFSNNFRTFNLYWYLSSGNYFQNKKTQIIHLWSSVSRNLNRCPDEVRAKHALPSRIIRGDVVRIWRPLMNILTTRPSRDLTDVCQLLNFPIWNRRQLKHIILELYEFASILGW